MIIEIIIISTVARFDYEFRIFSDTVKTKNANDSDSFRYNGNRNSINSNSNSSSTTTKPSSHLKSDPLDSPIQSGAAAASDDDQDNNDDDEENNDDSDDDSKDSNDDSNDSNDDNEDSNDSNDDNDDDDDDDDYIADVKVAASNNNKRKITMILKLSGEFGNNFKCLISAYRHKWWFEEQYSNIEIDIIGEHQDHPKWKGARTMITTCLVNFQHFDFKGGIWDKKNHFKEVQQAQNALLGTNASKFRLWHDKESVGCSSAMQCRKQAATYIQDMIHSNNTILNNGNYTISSKYSLPFLTSKYGSLQNVPMTKREEAKVQDLMRFNHDSSECCSLSPEPDETVFHLRNFISESFWLLEYAIYFHEITPKQIVPFLNLKPGDKLAIVGRHMDGPYVQKFVQAFNGTGVRVRVIRGQSPMQDLCFILGTKKELIAPMHSTFVQSTSFLAQIPTTFYSISSQENYNGTNILPLTPHPRQYDSKAPYIRYIHNLPDGNCKDDDDEWRFCTDED